jgi:hypothetical protein
MENKTYRPLFDLMRQEHGTILTESALTDIIAVVEKMGGEQKLINPNAPSGAEWVKATERLPETIKPTKLIIVKRYEGLPDVFSVRAMTPAQLADIVKFDLANFEWLDEAGQSKEGNKAREVSMLKWIITEKWKPATSGGWVKHNNEPPYVLTNKQLWNEWNNQQNRNK